MNTISNVNRVAVLSACFGVFVFAYTNCAPNLGPDSSLALKQTSSDSTAAPSAQSPITTTTPSAQLPITGTNPAGSSSVPKLLVSQSMNGPWIENGKTCRGVANYFKVSSVTNPATTQGCATKAGTSDCLNLNSYRLYTAAEIATGDIITTISATDSYNWPLNAYSFYISEPKSSSQVLTTLVGQSTFQACSGTAVNPAPGPVCNWAEVAPSFVIGGGPTLFPPATPCNTSTSGQTAFGIYRVYSTDPGTTADKLFRCNCN